MDELSLRSLIVAVLNQVVADACCSTVTYYDNPKRRLAAAREAWLWLHDDEECVRDYRHMLCCLAGADGEMFDRRVRAVTVPFPTLAQFSVAGALLKAVAAQLAKRVPARVAIVPPEGRAVRVVAEGGDRLSRRSVARERGPALMAA